MVKKILVSQPKPQSNRNPYTEIENKFNVRFEFMQLIKIVGIETYELHNLHINFKDYSSVIFRSRYGIDNYFRLCNELKINIPKSLKYFCISESIAKYLQKYIQYRKRNIFIAQQNNLENLIPEMQKHSEDRFLMIVSDVHKKKESEIFTQEGIHITFAPLYKTIPVEWPPDKPLDYYMIVLFTPMGAESLKKNFPNWKQKKTIVACMGNGTAQKLTDLGFRIDIHAPNETCPSITQAIEQYLETNIEKKGKAPQ